MFGGVAIFTFLIAFVGITIVSSPGGDVGDQFKEEGFIGFILSPFLNWVISKDFALDFLIFQIRGVEACWILLIGSIAILSKSFHVDYKNRIMECKYCGEKNFKYDGFIEVSESSIQSIKNPNYISTDEDRDKLWDLCIFCYWEVFGRTDPETELLTKSASEKMLKEAFFADEQKLQVEVKEWRKRLKEQFEKQREKVRESKRDDLDALRQLLREGEITPPEEEESPMIMSGSLNTGDFEEEKDEWDESWEDDPRDREDESEEEPEDE